MSITEILLKSAVDLATKVVEKNINSYNKNYRKNRPIPEKLSSHLKYIANWSSRIQFLGLGEAKNVDTESIQLIYNGTPRRFRGSNNENNIKNEADLLIDNNNYLLIGDPGSGKTTTLKRISRIILQEDSLTECDVCQYPILIRLKEIEKFHDIYCTIADTLGFKIEKVDKVKVTEKKVLVEDEYGNRHAETKKQEEITTYMLINDTPVNEFVITFLDDTRALLLIDGLDELDDRYLTLFLNDINALGLLLSTAKIIMTCRSGQYYTLKTLESFNVLEILPLDYTQIAEMASLWIKGVDGFLKELDVLPYKDLSNRPLLLSQLLLIYDKHNSLPKQPKEVYQLVIELLLKAWDSDRDIVRKSKYADFTVKRKSEFLAELSYRLMYKHRRLSFDIDDLVDIYKTIYYKYDLPLDEAEDVALEIETHTGIVTSSGYKKYEFSHLSLQEYLCADYIVRSPLTLETKELLLIHPDPIAIAIALSSDATTWFNNLIVDNEIFDVLKVKMHPFLTRLVTEKPIFSVSEILGFSIFNVFFSSYADSNSELKDAYTYFFRMKGIKESVNQLLINRKAVTIKQVKATPKIMVVSHTLPINSPSGSKFKKSFSTDINKLYDFFKLFDLEFKISHVTTEDRNLTAAP